MTRILAYTTPARGHLFPLVPILDELRDRGHAVALRTMAAEVAAMGGRGFATAPIDPAIESIAHDDHLARTPPAAQRRAVATLCARAGLDAPDLEAAIARERPDLVLVDVNAWGAQAVAERWGGPWATWCPYPPPIPSRDAPPFGPGLAPAHGPAGRLRDALARRLVTGAVERSLLPSLNQVRAAVGVPAHGGVDGIFRATPLFLYLSAEPFEYPRTDWPANVRMIGPCAWDPPAAAPEWLDAIERPIVVVTTSSEFQDDGRLATAAIEALPELGVHVVATVPAGADLPPAGPHAHVERFVAHRPLLARAACAVTHGGMGATQKALAAGVPVCAVPFGRDQLEVARRVAVAGAGTRLPARRLTPARLRAAVQDAMARSDGARRVADGYRAAGGPA
ncbi:MAG: glycosyltransferase, partial [Miltoncostaeaceae bacterium]